MKKALIARGITAAGSWKCVGATASALIQTKPVLIQHVADLAARLSLDPATPVGTQVFQDSNSTIYQLNAPSTAITGQFVAGDGVFTKRGTSNGKDWYQLVGSSDNGAHVDVDSIVWTGVIWQLWYPNSTLADTGTGGARPDLATWALSTVTGLTTRDLIAGFQINGITYKVNGATNGRNAYSDVLGVADNIVWNGSNKWWTDPANDAINTGDETFPWQGSPETTVTQSNVAAEGNWSTP